MYAALAAFTILMGIAVGWSIGANDAANSLGTAVGARVLTLRQAIILILVFGLLGAFLQGDKVSRTIGKGIVPMHEMDPTAATCLALAATFAACIWVVMATYWKMPISTSHSIVGGCAGGGLAMGVDVNWWILEEIFICWVFTPLTAAVLGYFVFRLLQRVFPKLVPPSMQLGLLKGLIIASGCYVAYTWGANDVANATGVLAGAGIVSTTASVLMGGLAIALGIVTWGYKVIETIGTQITNLMPLMAFAAQLSSAVNVHVFTMFGIPVSTSHSIVGAIFGVGLVRGVKVMNMKIMREIVVCWLATPFVSGALSFAVVKGLMAFARM